MRLQRLLAARDYRFVVNGHTHRRMVRSFGELTIINVGTLVREHDPCFALIDFDAGHVDYFDVGTRLDIAKAERCPLTR